ncbi:ATP-binding protein [bacterium]|nr:ATP-binding protein [bacterium]
MEPIEVVVLSGKGGAGKTSVAASIAALLKDKVVSADCDVDAGNLHLLLHPVASKTIDFVSGAVAVVNQNSCTGCGKCIEHCAFDSITMSDDKKAFVHEVLCEGCRFCATVCPEKCITMETHHAGHLFVGSNGPMPVVWADLKGGEDNSGKLVAVVKKEARKEAQRTEREIVIIDGPPGIGCPVTSSLSGAGVVLMVMESTVSGYHDVLRIYDLLLHFKLPGILLINKSDLNNEITEQAKLWAAENGVPVVAEIPYSSLMRDAVMQGVPPVEMGGDIGEKFREVSEFIIEWIKTNR